MAVAVMMVVVVAAAAVRAVLVMRMSMIAMLKRVPMVVMPVIMTGMLVVGVIVMAMAAGIGSLLGPEGARDLGRGAALAAHHLGEHVVVLDIDRVLGDLGRGVAVAHMPGDAHQPQRVFGADLQQVLHRRANRDETAVVEAQRVALVQHCGLVEVEHHLDPAFGAQHRAAALAILMVEGDDVEDAIGLDGGLADDGGGAQHGCSC